MGSLDYISPKASYYFTQCRKYFQKGEFNKAIEYFTYLINNPNLECYKYFATDRGFRIMAACAIGKWDIAEEDIHYIPDDYIIYVYSIDGKIDKKRLETSISARRKLKIKKSNYETTK